MVDTLRAAILSSLNYMLFIHYPRLRLGLNIKDFKVLNGIEGVLNLIER